MWEITILIKIDCSIIRLININDCIYGKPYRRRKHVSPSPPWLPCSSDFDFAATDGSQSGSCFRKEIPSKDSVDRPFTANVPTEILTFMKRITNIGSRNYKIVDAVSWKKYQKAMNDVTCMRLWNIMATNYSYPAIRMHKAAELRTNE